MKLPSIFAFQRPDNRPANSSRRYRRPFVENLEERRLLAIALSDATTAEGDPPGTQTLVFQATLDSPSTETITVHYATSDETAGAGSDYMATSGVLTFEPGQTQRTITVSVLSDNLDEENEALLVTLTDPVSSAILAQATGTIADDDPLPGLSIGDASVVEGNAGTTTLLFTVQLPAGSGLPVTVHYSTADGPLADSSARAGVDYLAQSGQLAFQPGTTEATIAIVVLGDTLNEVSENFVVNLSDAVNAEISDAQAEGTITNDDALPAISINDVSVSEGNSGTKNASFTVRLGAASGRPVSVQFNTADGTATAASGDYVAASGGVTFQPGETTKTLAVMINGDTHREANETFFVVLSGASNATISDTLGIGTITNDDAAGQISIGDIVVNEPAAGSVTAEFTVRLSIPNDLATTTVKFATANSTAIAGSDFTAASGTVTFAPGETTQTIAVPVLAGGGREAVERFVVNLSSATNATIGDSQAVGTIYDTSRPRIDSLSRLQGPVGSTVRITGARFGGATVVRFGGAAAHFRVVSPSLIIATVPVAARSGPISVANRSGTSVSIQSFGVVPRITAFTPTRARVGSTVAINGKGLGEVTAVLFNGTLAPILSVTPNLVRVRVPAGATSGPITVVSPIASHSTAGLATPNFRVVANTAVASATAAEIDAVITLERELSGITSPRRPTPGGGRR